MDHTIRRIVVLFVIVLGSTFIGVMPLKAASPIRGPAGLEQLIQEGLANNKELKSLEAKVAGAKERIPFAGALEDPRVAIGVLNLPTDTFDLDQEPMTQKQVSLSQKLPWFGKLSLKEQRQTLVAARQQAILEAKRFELARQITDTYYDLGFAATSLGINARLGDMVEQIIKVAATRYASGRGLQQDVLQAQVELSKLLDEKIVLTRQHRTLEDKMNGLLNRESFESIPTPEDPKYAELKLDLMSLQERVLKQNPWLRVKGLEAEIATLDIRMAQLEYWPDVTFTVAYGQRDDDPLGRERADFFSGTLAFNLPLWKKTRQDRVLSATQQDHVAAENTYQNLVRTLPHRLNALVTGLTDLQENFRLISDTLMLQAEHLARSSLSAYVVGKVEFNTMVNAQIRLLRFDLQARKYLYTIHQKRAELVELLGAPLETSFPVVKP